MRGFPISMILLLASVTLSAQAPLPAPPPISQGCPVNFFARRTGGLIVQYANGSRDSLGSHGSATHGLYITFAKHDASRIARIIVTVHGMPAQGGIMPVRSDKTSIRSNAASDIAETFILERHPGASLQDSLIWLHKIGPARSVELTEIDFADGSTWQSSRDSFCDTEPSPFLLVAATAAAR